MARVHLLPYIVGFKRRGLEDKICLYADNTLHLSDTAGSLSTVMQLTVLRKLGCNRGSQYICTNL